MNLITLKTFDNPIEAHLFRTVLENEGIPCKIFDELMVGLNPLYTITVGGVKLKIRETDLEAALEILS
ncbi:MAG: putative signal transducing protein [Bacteroidia bacterium]